MALPTYDEFVNHESWEVEEAYRKRTGHGPAISDMYHNSWRRWEERWSHRDIIHDILGEPLEDGGAGGDEDPITELSPLRIEGAYFLDSDNQIHRRKGVTAFTLSKRAATGRKADALNFMDWAVEEGFNEFRVFTQTSWTGNGDGVEEGWGYDPEACLWVANEAAKRGARVEFVAHTFPYEINAMVDHLEEVDMLCVATGSFLEVANEPPRNNIPLSDLLNRYKPRAMWASGKYDPTPYPAGQWINDHSPRDGEWPRKFKGAIEFSDGSGPYVPFTPPFSGPVMEDEPPQVEQTLSPDDWESYGAGSALFGCGGRMHSNPTLQKCEIPTDGTVLACVKAFVRGLNVVPLQRYQPGYEHPDDQGSLRRYRRRGQNGKWYEISVRPYEFKEV